MPLQRAHSSKVKSLGEEDVVGEIIDLELEDHGISIFHPTQEMCFSKNQIVKGHYIYSLAETLALAVIDAEAALVGVANIKIQDTHCKRR
jgi:acyl-coenzyme A thioesterase PaaI-like protein